MSPPDHPVGTVLPAAGRPRLLLCVNPVAGGGRGAGAGAEAAARLRAGGADVEMLRVPGDDGTAAATRYARALAERLAGEPGSGPAAVVVVGGDGMVHASANVLAGAGIPLGVVPAGTGNDTVRSWGWAAAGVREATGAILCALHRPPREVDLLRVELAPVAGRGRVSRYAVSGVNVAFDAAVNATANGLRWPRGGTRYVLAVLLELLRYRPVRLRTHLDGGTGEVADLSGPAFLLCLMNGRYIGGGMEVTPGTRVDDGVLEAFHVPPMSPLGFLRMFPRVFSGRHTGIPEVTIRPARAVTVETVESVSPGGTGGASDGTAPIVHGDGEPLGRLPLTVTVEPGRLAVLDLRDPREPHTARSAAPTLGG